jgi:hypothetical protein
VIDDWLGYGYLRGNENGSLGHYPYQPGSCFCPLLLPFHIFSHCLFPSPCGQAWGSPYANGCCGVQPLVPPMPAPMPAPMMPYNPTPFGNDCCPSPCVPQPMQCAPTPVQVPITTYRPVTVDRGSYQMVWVPRPVTEMVPHTSWQTQYQMPDALSASDADAGNRLCTIRLRNLRTNDADAIGQRPHEFTTSDSDADGVWWQCSVSQSGHRVEWWQSRLELRKQLAARHEHGMDSSSASADDCSTKRRLATESFGSEQSILRRSGPALPGEPLRKQDALSGVRSVASASTVFCLAAIPFVCSRKLLCSEPGVSIRNDDAADAGCLPACRNGRPHGRS